MNFISSLLRTVDILWALITIPCCIIFGAMLIAVFPVPTAIVAIIVVILKFDNVSTIRSMGGMSFHPEEYERASQHAAIVAVLFTILVIAAYAGWIYWTISRGGLCEDTTGLIPWTMNEILQKLIPHTC